METWSGVIETFSESLTGSFCLCSNCCQCFLPLYSFTWADDLMFSLPLRGKKDLLWQVKVEGRRERTGGRGGKKSKQMMVPGKRFPPLGGNSLWPEHDPPCPQPSSISHILYKGIHQSTKAELMLYQTISLVSEMYPNRLKQHSSIRAVRWYCN